MKDKYITFSFKSVLLLCILSVVSCSSVPGLSSLSEKLQFSKKKIDMGPRRAPKFNPGGSKAGMEVDPYGRPYNEKDGVAPYGNPAPAKGFSGESPFKRPPTSASPYHPTPMMPQPYAPSSSFKAPIPTVAKLQTPPKVNVDDYVPSQFATEEPTIDNNIQLGHKQPNVASQPNDTSTALLHRITSLEKQIASLKQSPSTHTATPKFVPTTTSSSQLAHMEAQSRHTASPPVKKRRRLKFAKFFDKFKRQKPTQESHRKHNIEQPRFDAKQPITPISASTVHTKPNTLTNTASIQGNDAYAMKIRQLEQQLSRAEQKIQQLETTPTVQPQPQPQVKPKRRLKIAKFFDKFKRQQPQASIASPIPPQQKRNNTIGIQANNQELQKKFTPSSTDAKELLALSQLSEEDKATTEKIRPTITEPINLEAEKEVNNTQKRSFFKRFSGLFQRKSTHITEENQPQKKKWSLFKRQKDTQKNTVPAFVKREVSPIETPLLGKDDFTQPIELFHNEELVPFTEIEQLQPASKKALDKEASNHIAPLDRENVPRALALKKKHKKSFFARIKNGLTSLVKTPDITIIKRELEPTSQETLIADYQLAFLDTNGFPSLTTVPERPVVSNRAPLRKQLNLALEETQRKQNKVPTQFATASPHHFQPTPVAKITATPYASKAAFAPPSDFIHTASGERVRLIPPSRYAKIRRAVFYRPAAYNITD